MVDVLNREKSNSTVQASKFDDRLTFDKTTKNQKDSRAW